MISHPFIHPFPFQTVLRSFHHSHDVYITRTLLAAVYICLPFLELTESAALWLKASDVQTNKHDHVLRWGSAAGPMRRESAEEVSNFVPLSATERSAAVVYGPFTHTANLIC